jgi:hypothetical protein
MFIFCVPFKARDCCANWPLSQQLCAHAISSMLAGPLEVRVVLVCHELPKGLPGDGRLIVKSITTPKPQTREQMMEDKYLKIKMALVVAREFAPAWLMRADADDLISRRLVKFIQKQPTNTAWYSEEGWAHRLGSRWALKLHNFHKLCGTSCVTYVTSAELPETFDQPSREFYLLTQGHNLMVDYLRKLDMTVNPIPFPTTVYVTDSGENWSGPWLSVLRSKRWTLRKPLNSRPISATLRDEFGF